MEPRGGDVAARPEERKSAERVSDVAVFPSPDTEQAACTKPVAQVFRAVQHDAVGSEGNNFSTWRFVRPNVEITGG